MEAAYASLVSLLNTVDQIQIHPLLSTCLSNYPIESLPEMIDFFLDFVEKYSDVENEEAEDLVRRIADAAHEAEDVIEVQAADLVRSVASPQQSQAFLLSLQKIIDEMDSIKEKVINVEEEIGCLSQPPTPSSSPAPAAATTATTMVGFDAYLMQLLDQLTGDHCGQQILPIVGMGGIGKTTLARNVYDNRLIVEHFYVRAWVTVSQQFSATEILSQALSCLGGFSFTTVRADDELGEILYKKLLGQKYLIVLDDLWSLEAWDKIRFFFPENNNGSRIAITTRQSELVDYFGTSALKIDFLDDKSSWHLFCEKAFPQQSFPPELELIGKKIVEKCNGLPLTISVIGGLLGKTPTQKYWEKISRDKSLILNTEEGNEPLSTLYLSYKCLPVWLKSCFLYLGLFPEDHKIAVPQLIRLWVAEGLIRPKQYQSLEDIAENYIKELVDRNLVLVEGFRINKYTKSCYIHDLVRDLCIRTAEKVKYFYVQRSVDRRRHVIVDERNATIYPRDRHTSRTPSILDPVIFNGIRSTPFKSRLLRVLFGTSNESELKEVNLRFLRYKVPNVSSTYSLPSSTSLLWTLQTLIIERDGPTVAPPEIWKMPQLRHIIIPGSFLLPYPVPSEDEFVLANLQSLSLVDNLDFSEEVCKRIPNVKYLGICCSSKTWSLERDHHLQNVGLNKLEILHCRGTFSLVLSNFLQSLKLLRLFKELHLQECYLDRSDTAMIASLPHLEILEFWNCRMEGAEWNCAEQEFLSLKHLIISRCNDLRKWTIADGSSFPVLETLTLSCLSKLEEVPQSIEDKATLEKIRLWYCSQSVFLSIVKIIEEQENLGNQGLLLQIYCGHAIQAKAWREKIETLGLTFQNIHIC